MDTREQEREDPSEVVAESLRAWHERELAGEGVDFRTRVFGTRTFFRLWLSQAIASLGDWLGFMAIIVLAARIGNSESSIGFVMAARIIPGFFFSAGAGVLIDRMDRKQVMVATTLVRAAVVASLPFVDSILGLVFASLILELATLMFSPAKEATVPNLVATERLTSANSLSMAAAYGTYPVAAILFALLAKVSDWLGNIDALNALQTSQEALAFYANVVCYLVAALMIYRLSIPKEHIHRHDEESIDLGQFFREVKEGWHYAFINPVVRAVNIGLATGLVGGGMLVPLGQTFAARVLGAGASGFGVLQAALGTGVAVGVIGISIRQARLKKLRVFIISLFCAGISLMIGASMSELWLAALMVGVMGIFAGSVYVLGFTLVHENVEDEIRGRVFAGLYTLVRVCVLVSMAAGPILTGILDEVSEDLVQRTIDLGYVEISVPGVRLTLWFASIIMLIAAALAALSVRGTRATVTDRVETAA